MVQTPSDKITYLDKKITELSKEISSIKKVNELAIMNLSVDLNRVIAEQRELIVNLQRQIDSERLDRQNRRAKAIAQLKSE